MRFVYAIALCAIVAAPALSQTPLTSAFTYQGELVLSGSPIDGSADMQFTLYDASTTGTVVGGPIIFDGAGSPPVDVVDGKFTVSLDFGVAALNGERRWLEIDVRYPTGSGSYETLSPRQELTGSPYSLQTRGIFVDDQNRVGLGTTTPAWSLDIQDTQAVTRLTSTDASFGSVVELKNTTSGAPFLGAINFNDAAGTYPGQISYENDADHTMTFRVDGAEPLKATQQGILVAGRGITVLASGSGTSEAAIQSYQFETDAGMAGYFINNSNFATTHLQNNGTGEVLWLEKPEAGQFIVATNGSDWKFWVDGDGVTHTKVLQILGGSDLSETFDVNSPDVEMRAGMTVSIDPEHEGRLEVSHRAYDRRVAGIVSGAGGINPGMVMGQQGSVADGDHPIALTGRVYCLVDADSGAIEPGDLLTTSNTPGHAMRVVNSARAQGAIIGKAMGRLESGRGLVLVLVGLQ